MMPSIGHSWVSSYIFLNGEVSVEMFDHAIRNIVKPAISECRLNLRIYLAFFIRYWQDGPHLRVRILVAESDADAVRRIVEKHVSSGGGSQVTLPALFWNEYVPETARYGGPRGVQLAEKLFDVSSESSIRLLDEIASGHADRTGAALGSMISVLWPMTCGSRREAAGIARMHQAAFTDITPSHDLAMYDRMFDAKYRRRAEPLRQLVEHLWENARCAQLPEILHDFQQGARDIRSELALLAEEHSLFPPERGQTPVGIVEAVRRLAPSYMHMTNNRLGVSRTTEAYLGSVIFRVLRPD